MEPLRYFNSLGEDKVILLNLVVRNEIVQSTEPYIGEGDLESMSRGSSSHAISTSVSVPHIRNVFELFDWWRFDDPEDLTRDELRVWQY